MFRRFGESVRKFMYGRYGSDQLNIVLLVAAIAVSLTNSFLSLIFRNSFVYIRILNPILYLLMLALLPTMLSLICTTRAISYIGSTPTAILGALEPVTAIFFGITLFCETLTPREVMGITIIIASVTIVVAGGSLSATLTRVRKMFPRLKH